MKTVVCPRLFTCDIEMIDIKDVNTACDRTVQGDVKYRFVIDMGSLETT